ncbi:MAG: 6-hydroxymethylpterin diphosphokinase MptE-like protein, partial [Planctomycetota bacterium]
MKSGSASAEPTPAGAAERLARNLAMLSIGSPGVVSAVRDAGPAFQAGFAVADDGLLTGTLTEATGRRVSLASARRPGEEAERLAGTVDLGSAAAVLVLGFAMGHHVAALLRAAKSSAVVVVYEPDVALLRAVLERQDHTDWLGDPLVRIVTDPDDAVAMTRALEGSEGLVSMGLSIAAHPPSVRRLGDGAERVQQTLISALRSIRTNVVTTLAQSHVTIRNQLMNLDTYARSPGIEPLRGAAAGRPAVVVSAGPSVQRNLHRLAEPGVRDRFVLIATQTMLKPMLELGIRPHFVTALDYHAISGRFYEGLSASDVEGVTLVGEAKANAAIFGAWPGAVRTPADGFLDRLLGDAAPAKGTLRAGSTVAHLAYYLARFLGCDPVLLIGQDLGFTDGQYYGDGASIHGVWGGELNEFCTLETLEWQRIRRMGGRLIRATDHLGRPMFTDEQMHAYRVQFERDFEADLERGLTTIDATEGGVAKSGTTPMPLADAMASHADAPPVRLPDVPTDESAAGSVRAGVDRLREVRAGVWRVGDLSRTAEGVLTEMIEHAGDQPRVNRLIERAHELRDEVKSVTPAWDLVHTLNQRGTLNRAKADRSIYLGDDDAYARQRAQMERDRENLTQLAGSAEMLGEIMDAAIRAHDGRAEKLTRQT